MKYFSLIFFFLVTGLYLSAQVDARMLRYPDVSQDQIVFTYANDLWICPKEGGMAVKLSSPEGEESFARFSPDGTQIAFTANYDGNSDVYVIPTLGGLPQRLTYHGMTDRVLDWHPDGNRVLFHSSRESGRQRYGQFFAMALDGGMAEKLPVPYGEFASYSNDGKFLAYTDKSRAFRTWKRYRGGTAPDIRLFDLENKKVQLIAPSDANDELPMWSGNRTVYFLSDRGPNKRFNIWSYDLKSEELRQITRFKDFDIHFPAIGPSDIVFEAGGKLYLLDLSTESLKEIKVDVVTDQEHLKPKVEKVQNYTSSASISPGGKRAVVEARGELFSLPAEKGYVKNLTSSSGEAERYPAWSPNGRYLAYWSDKSGEYELYLKDFKENGAVQKMTSYGPGFRYQTYWSPDSKKLSFMDEAGKIYIFNIESKETKEIDQDPMFMNHSRLSSFQADWSADSRWMAYNRNLENMNGAVFLYDMEDNQLHQVTSGYYNDRQPVFDPEGKYLYYQTNRNFDPEYSSMDGTWIYPNATQIAAVGLQKGVPSPMAPENDEATIKEEKSDEEEKKNGKKDNGKKVDIELEGFESRAVLLPFRPGNYASIAATKGKLIAHRAPNTGSAEREAPLVYWDFKEREEKTILPSVSRFQLAADGEHLLVMNGRSMGVIKVAPSQKLDKKLPLEDMEATIDPMAEYKQIFADAWRLQRDYFYDAGMHGVDWDGMKERYGALLKDAVTREDLNFILGELIGELNASHTYRGGGDTEEEASRNVGYLGIDWGIKSGKYYVRKIIRGAEWDIEDRSPLDQPGVQISEGDYILAVNGQPMDISKEPCAAFDGLAGKTVELSVNSYDSADSARMVIVEPMRSETRLRHLAWIESNRRRVEEATNGRVGYVYVRSTGRDGQNEMVRQYQAQWNKEGLIIDERFNSGGQIPDRFVEFLNRPPVAFWDVRHGKSMQHPIKGHFGKKVMLINGWSGSGGDAFPHYFKRADVGPLIGTRTWGGLIGISGVPQLVDGGRLTVPTFRMFDPEGDWFPEGYGVDPDIEVPEDPEQLAKGIDPQLERAIQEVMKDLPKTPKDQVPPSPKAEKRSE